MKKLSFDTVRRIIKTADNSTLESTEIAEMFSVSRETVNRVKSIAAAARSGERSEIVKVCTDYRRHLAPLVFAAIGVEMPKFNAESEKQEKPAQITIEEIETPESEENAACDNNVAAALAAINASLVNITTALCYIARNMNGGTENAK